VLVPGRGLELTQLFRSTRHPLSQRDLLLQRAQRRPQRALQRHALLVVETLRRVGVTHAAAEAQQVALVHLVEHAATGRAGDTGGLSHLEHAFGGAVELERRLHFQERAAGGRLLRVLAGQLGKQRPHLADGQHVVDVHVFQRAARHHLHQRLVGILHQRQPAAALDRDQAGGSVVQRPGEDDADHSRAEGIGCRPEERVDGRPVAVLAGSADHAHMRIVEEEMVVRRRHVDAIGDDGLAVARVLGRKLSG